MGNTEDELAAELKEKQGILALKCLNCGAGTVIIAGPRGVSDALNDALDLLRRFTVDDFDKTPVGEALWVEVREFLEQHGG